MLKNRHFISCGMITNYKVRFFSTLQDSFIYLTDLRGYVASSYNLISVLEIEVKNAQNLSRYQMLAFNNNGNKTAAIFQRLDYRMFLQHIRMF